MRDFIVIFCLVCFMAQSCAKMATINLMPEGMRLEQASTQPVAFDDFNIIDDDNPPTDGIWMPWGQAKVYALRLEMERVEWQKLLYRQRRDYDLEYFRRKMAENDLAYAISGESKFWMKWGLPIGLGAGLLLGVASAIAITSTTHR